MKATNKKKKAKKRVLRKTRYATRRVHELFQFEDKLKHMVDEVFTNLYQLRGDDWHVGLAVAKNGRAILEVWGPDCENWGTEDFEGLIDYKLEYTDPPWLKSEAPVWIGVFEAVVEKLKRAVAAVEHVDVAAWIAKQEAEG